MASLVARALMEDRPHGEHDGPRSGIDRVLRTTFWQSSSTPHDAPVISLASRRAVRAPESRTPTSR
jgi:hypothetical protein